VCCCCVVAQTVIFLFVSNQFSLKLRSHAKLVFALVREYFRRFVCNKSLSAPTPLVLVLLINKKKTFKPCQRCITGCESSKVTVGRVKVSLSLSRPRLYLTSSSNSHHISLITVPIPAATLPAL
jgi:hypothetical protein